MCKSLEQLEKITPNLPKIRTLEDFTIESGNGFKIYNLEGGKKLFSKCIYQDEDISLAKSHFPQGGLLEHHHHGGSYEILIILNGELEVVLDGDKLNLKKHDSLKIGKGELHSALAKVDTTIIVATVPSDDGFPKKSGKQGELFLE